MTIDERIQKNIKRDVSLLKEKYDNNPDMTFEELCEEFLMIDISNEIDEKILREMNKEYHLYDE